MSHCKICSAFIDWSKYYTGLINLPQYFWMFFNKSEKNLKDENIHCNDITREVVTSKDEQVIY